MPRQSVPGFHAPAIAPAQTKRREPTQPLVRPKTSGKTTPHGSEAGAAAAAREDARPVSEPLNRPSRPAPNEAAAAADPRRTVPSATWGPLVEAADRDPRRTVSSATWDAIHAAPSPAAPAQTAADEPDEPPDGADAQDDSLGVSVVFDLDDMNANVVEEMAASRAALVASEAQDPKATAPKEPVVEVTQEELPADVDEPSLSVSVVFEPDDLPSQLLEGVPSPIEEAPAAATPADVPPSDAPQTSADVGLEATAEAPASAEPASGQTVVVFEGDGSSDSFFDEALANFPTAPVDDELLEAGESTHHAAETVAEPELDVSVDDGIRAVIEIGPFADDDMVNVPPPQKEEGASALAAELRPAHVPDPLDDDDSDNDATLVRLPTAAAPAPAARTQKPDEPIVRPEARDEEELTPTRQAAIDPGRKNQRTRREAKDASALAAEDEASDARPTLAREVPLDEDDTAALLRAPLAPPPQQAASAPAVASLRHHDETLIGRRIADGKYTIESLIGSGAAGAVYRATHRELRRTVAIKVLHPHYQQDPQFMTSFRGEALAASQLDHPNVMRVLDFGQEPDGLVYIVMEYLSGRTLQSLLDEERRLPTERAVEIMIQVCAALSVAHDHGIIHRDIKPDNIMLVPSRDDEGATFELVKVCDFGIAALQNPRAEDAELAATEHVIAGTPEYMSPEQARGAEVDARSDVYACGICLYELVTGRPPFIGNNPAEILIKQIEETPRPPSQIIKGLDPLVEEIILRAIQKDPDKRHQSARELRVELKELIDPGEGYNDEDKDELSIVENVPVLDDPASGFPGFFIAFSSAILRFGRFERGHHEYPQAMKELQRLVRVALRGRSELTFARRDVQKTIGFVVMSGTAEIVDLRRLLGSQLMGSFGEPFIQALVEKGIASLTIREGIPDTELAYIVEMMHGPLAHEDLRKELFAKPLTYLSILFVTDVVGRDRKLAWKVGLCASRLTRDLRALCNVRGLSLKKMRETRDELIGGVARLLTRGDEVKQFIFNADLVDEAVANLRGFSSFSVAPLIIQRVLHESCAEAATILLNDFDAGTGDHERTQAFLHLFAQRLVTERSPKSDAAVAELYRRKIVTEDEMPRDLKESIRAQTLADALVREPSQFLRTLDLIVDPAAYENELQTLEAAMATLARRSEAVALLAVMMTLAAHAKGAGKPGPRENAALRTMKTMLDKQRLLPIATTLLVGPPHQREAARQLILIAGSAGAQALFTARESTTDQAARAIFVSVLRETGPAGWTLISQVLPRMELQNDAELALVEDLLRAIPDRADPAFGETVAKFLAHPMLRPTALSAIVPLWGERAKKPLVEALEYAEEPTRIVALTELRRLGAIDDYVFSVLERFLTMKGSASEELRAAAAAALADVPARLRARAIQLLSKAVEGKRGFFASLRGNTDSDESVVVMEAMGIALLKLDRNEGVRALKGRLSRSEGLMRARLSAVLQMAS
jgi:serine/threonine-protein kinase